METSPKQPRRACPFCHHDDLEIRRDENAYFVVCEYCSVTGPSGASQTLAVDMWDGEVEFSRYLKGAKNSLPDVLKDPEAPF